MSATQVISEIQNLPPEERAVVLDFVRKLDRDLASVGGSIRHMDPAKAKAISERIFSDNAELFRKLAQ
jgi:hypothetical protein